MTAAEEFFRLTNAYVENRDHRRAMKVGIEFARPGGCDRGLILAAAVGMARAASNRSIPRQLAVGWVFKQLIPDRPCLKEDDNEQDDSNRCNVRAFDLSGRVTIVTGGNGGIGFGMAKALAAAGSAVSIWGRNAEKNAKAAAAIAAAGGVCEALVCDVSEPSSVDLAVRKTLDRFGRIDGCFANAGIGGGDRKAFVERSDADLHNMLDVNVGGVFRVFRAVARHMIERAQNGDAFGRLVATSSLASRFGTARNEHYAASKAAVNSMVQSLAVELARYGVTANAILPGWITTEMTESLMANEKFVSNVMHRIPLRRFGTPEDFGGIAVYLMSTASSYHTGDCILIDGGYAAF